MAHPLKAHIQQLPASGEPQQSLWVRHCLRDVDASAPACATTVTQPNTPPGSSCVAPPAQTPAVDSNGAFGALLAIAAHVESSQGQPQHAAAQQDRLPIRPQAVRPRPAQQPLPAVSRSFKRSRSERCHPGAPDEAVAEPQQRNRPAGAVASAAAGTGKPPLAPRGAAGKRGAALLQAALAAAATVPGTQLPAALAAAMRAAEEAAMQKLTQRAMELRELEAAIARMERDLMMAEHARAHEASCGLPPASA